MISSPVHTSCRLDRHRVGPRARMPRPPEVVRVADGERAVTRPHQLLGGLRGLLAACSGRQQPPNRSPLPHGHGSIGSHHHSVPDLTGVKYSLSMHAHRRASRRPDHHCRCAGPVRLPPRRRTGLHDRHLARRRTADRPPTRRHAGRQRLVGQAVRGLRDRPPAAVPHRRRRRTVGTQPGAGIRRPRRWPPRSPPSSGRTSRASSPRSSRRCAHVHPKPGCARRATAASTPRR